ncbi:hypothetical protein [Luteolibacter sp. Populi]|uniref:hypothetical protein n=1 Tax=Luteolibacter sp. Populi TaxID=3230487 RepID=UPI0034671BF1
MISASDVIQGHFSPEFGLLNLEPKNDNVPAQERAGTMQRKPSYHFATGVQVAV